METLKKILKIILLTTYLFQKSVNASPKSALSIIPDLNKITDEVRGERERCVEIIFTELNCERPANTRFDIPKQVFGTINVNNLRRRETQQYFRHMHDTIIPLTKYLEPRGMLTPIEYCLIYETALFHAQIHSSLRSKTCIVRLSEKFPITDDQKQILQHTFNTFVMSELYPNDYAMYYYNKILPFLGFNNELMTPYEYCKGLTDDHVVSPVISPNKKRGPGNPEASSSSPKQSKTGSSRRALHLST